MFKKRNKKITVEDVDNEYLKKVEEENSIKEEPEVVKTDKIDVKGTYKYYVEQELGLSLKEVFFTGVEYDVVVNFLNQKINIKSKVILYRPQYHQYGYNTEGFYFNNDEEYAYKWLFEEINENKGEYTMNNLKESIVEEINKHIQNNNVEEMKKLLNSNPVEINFSFETSNLRNTK